MQGPKPSLYWDPRVRQKAPHPHSKHCEHDGACLCTLHTRWPTGIIIIMLCSYTMDDSVPRHSSFRQRFAVLIQRLARGGNSGSVGISLLIMLTATIVITTVILLLSVLLPVLVLLHQRRSQGIKSLRPCSEG